MGSLCGNKGCHGILWQHKKKMITDRLTFIQIFNLGINEEGYWNYFHMALQFEDIFDVLCVKIPECDFLILMDQLSGDRKKWREG